MIKLTPNSSLAQYILALQKDYAISSEDIGELLTCAVSSHLSRYKNPRVLKDPDRRYKIEVVDSIKEDVRAYWRANKMKSAMVDTDINSEKFTNPSRDSLEGAIELLRYRCEERQLSNGTFLSLIAESLQRASKTYYVSADNLLSDRWREYDLGRELLLNSAYRVSRSDIIVAPSRLFE